MTITKNQTLYRAWQLQESSLWRRASSDGSVPPSAQGDWTHDDRNRQAEAQEALDHYRGSNSRHRCRRHSSGVKTVLNGTTVTWTNNGMTHTVTSCDTTHYTSAGCPSQNAAGLNSFDSGTMSDGATFMWTFTVKGTYYYYCTLHPWMQGEIIVQ